MPGIVLINPDTGNAESFAPEVAQGAIQAGYQMPLNDPDGNPVAAPHADAQRLMSQGYLQPTPAQLQDLMDVSTYGTPSQQALSFVEGVTKGIAGPLAPMVESAVFPTTPEDIAKRQQINPGTVLAGEMTGLVGGGVLLPQASLAGVVSRAGSAAAKAVTLTGTFGKAAQYAVQGAVEGALFGASNQVHEAVLGDPKAVSENMLAHIGMSAALGGAFNLAIAPIAHAAAEAVQKGAGFLGRIDDSTGQHMAEPKTFAEQLPHMGIPDTERKAILGGLKELKLNIKEIDDAGALLGITPMESQRSASKFVQDAQSALSKEPTWTGIQTQQRFHEIFKATSQHMDDALGADIGMTRAAAGDELKTGLIKAIEQQATPINEIYQAVREVGDDVFLSPRALKQISGNVLKIEGLLSSTGKPISEGSPAYKLAQRVSEELASGNLGTANDLRLYAQRLRADTIANPELKFVAGQIQGKLDDLFDASVLRQAKMFKPTSPHFAKIQQLSEDYAGAKASYAVFREQLDTLGLALGKKLRKGEGAGAFVDWLSEAPAEKVADKLFTKNNHKFLSFLSETFPTEAKLLSGLRKSTIRDAAMENGMVLPAKAIREIEKLEPEIQAFLFSSDALKKIKASEVLMEAMPKNVNPSETAKTLVLLDWLKNPLSLPSAEAASMAKKFLIQSLVKASPEEAPLIAALIKTAEYSHKTLTQIEKRAGSIFAFGATQGISGGELGYASARALEIKKEKDKKKKERKGYAEGGVVSMSPVMSTLKDKATAFATNPELFLDHVTNATSQIHDYAPNISVGLVATLSTAANFLYSKTPNTEKLAPLDLTRVPSSPEIAAYNRYASVIDSPTMVMDHIKDGSVTPEHIEALSTVYPSMYESMQVTLMDKMTDFLAKHPASDLPYKTRLGLSMFLGQNLDSTTSPGAILENQQILSNAAQMAAAQQASFSKSGVGKMKVANQQTKAQQAVDRRAQRSA